MDYAYWVSRKYNPAIKAEAANPPKFICGHSHILKVMFDKKHVAYEPPACGKSGFIRYACCVCNRGDKIKDLEMWKLKTAAMQDVK
jgi:hypothetical protein